MLSHVEMCIPHTQLLGLFSFHLTSGHDESVKKVSEGLKVQNWKILSSRLTSNFANDWENCDTNTEKLVDSKPT
jgi:hypothetical protein